VARSLPGAVIHDHNLAAERVRQMALDGTVTCIDGTSLRLAADTICVHGDNPAALQLVARIRQELMTAGVEICPPHTFL
jgi:UPF0271 protein